MTDPAVEAAQRATRNWPGRRVNLDELATAAREALKPIRELHRPVHAIFSGSGGLELRDPCPDCGGKAGVHPCGCWGDTDVTFHCLTCRPGTKGRLTEWPCGTAKLVYSSEELDRHIERGLVVGQSAAKKGQQEVGRG